MSCCRNSSFMRGLEWTYCLHAHEVFSNVVTKHGWRSYGSVRPPYLFGRWADLDQ
jgi:hypothetical protein